MAHNGVEDGAADVDMGRNIFHSDDPIAMIRAICAVVHESVKPEQAYEEFVRSAAKGHGSAPITWPKETPPRPSLPLRPT